MVAMEEVRVAEKAKAEEEKEAVWRVGMARPVGGVGEGEGTEVVPGAWSRTAPSLRTLPLGRSNGPLA